MPLPALTFVLLLSGAAQAVSQAGSVAQAQAALAQTQAEASRLSTRRQAMQSELDWLGAEIAERKRALPSGAEPGAELTRLLQDSASLAALLGDLQRQVAEASVRSQQAADELAHSCDSELGALQTQWGQAPASGRTTLEGRIAEVSKSCSGRSLGQLDKPAGSSAAVPASALAATATDDAQALREKADFLRDREDVLRHRIAQMSQRIDALGRERSLARRVSEFVKEQDLFDENDTRVSASRTEFGAAPQPGTPTGGTALASQSASRGGGTQGAGATDSSGLGGSAPVTGTGTGSTKNGAGGTTMSPTSLGGVASPADAPSGAEGSQGSRQTYTGARPEELRVGLDAAGDDDSLDGLNAQRTALQQEAQKLHEAAMALERNASEKK